MRAKTSWFSGSRPSSFCLHAVSVASAQTSQPNVVEVRQSDSLLNGALIGAGVGVAEG